MNENNAKLENTSLVIDTKLLASSLQDIERKTKRVSSQPERFGAKRLKLDQVAANCKPIRVSESRTTCATKTVESCVSNVSSVNSMSLVNSVRSMTFCSFWELCELLTKSPHIMSLKL